MVQQKVQCGDKYGSTLTAGCFQQAGGPLAEQGAGRLRAKSFPPCLDRRVYLFGSCGSSGARPTRVLRRLKPFSRYSAWFQFQPLPAFTDVSLLTENWREEDLRHTMRCLCVILGLKGSLLPTLMNLENETNGSVHWSGLRGLLRRCCSLK